MVPWGVVIATLAAATAVAEVVVMDERGFVSRHRLEIAATPAQVFEALAKETGAFSRGSIPDR